LALPFTCNGMVSFDTDFIRACFSNMIEGIPLHRNTPLL
jgi:hypothetical protein